MLIIIDIVIRQQHRNLDITHKGSVMVAQKVSRKLMSIYCRQIGRFSKKIRWHSLEKL